jgi:hypothetical protein
MWRLTRKFNESLVFDPSEVHMAYTIRDPVRNGKFFKIQMKCFCAVNVSVHASGAVDRNYGLAPCGGFIRAQNIEMTKRQFLAFSSLLLRNE